MARYRDFSKREYLGPVNLDRAAPGCDDQLPVISHVGRGLHGNDFYVEVADKRPVDPLVPGWEDQSPAETYLTGKSFDYATNSWTPEWVSENISGGQLYCQYNLRPYSNPTTFTLTFIYRKPENPLLPGEVPGNDPDEWTMTTEAIPYVQTVDEDGNPLSPLVGSGVGNLYVRMDEDSEWQEMLVFPEGTTAQDYNAPAPEDAWSANITLSDFMDWDNIITNGDLAKVAGVTEQNIADIIAGGTGQFAGSDSIKDYVDDSIGEASSELTENLNDYKIFVGNFMTDILAKIQAGGTIDSTTGHITWPSADIIPIGNIDITAGSIDSGMGIFTHGGDPQNYDLNFQ